MSGRTTEASDVKTLSADTSPQIEALMIDLIRKQSPEQRAQKVLALNNRARAMQLVGIRRRHPEADERELRMRLASLWLDRQTMIRLFAWDPEEQGLG
jgi:hypothetical protein